MKRHSARSPWKLRPDAYPDPRRASGIASHIDDDESRAAYLRRLPGEAIKLRATHVPPTIITEHLALAMEEHLETVSSRGVPDAMLTLKVGCLVRCLADISPHEGVSSGALLRVLKISTILVTAETVPSDPDAAPVRLLIPRFKFQLKTGSMSFGRIQFPLCLANEPESRPSLETAADRRPAGSAQHSTHIVPAAAAPAPYRVDRDLRKRPRADHPSAPAAASAAPAAATGRARVDSAGPTLAPAVISASTLGHRRREDKVPAAQPPRPASHVISLISDDEDDASEGSREHQHTVCWEHAEGRSVPKKLRRRTGSSPSIPRAVDLTEDSD